LKGNIPLFFEDDELGKQLWKKMAFHSERAKNNLIPEFILSWKIKMFGVCLHRNYSKKG